MFHLWFTEKISRGENLLEISPRLVFRYAFVFLKWIMGTPYISLCIFLCSIDFREEITMRWELPVLLWTPVLVRICLRQFAVNKLKCLMTQSSKNLFPIHTVILIASDCQGFHSGIEAPSLTISQGSFIVAWLYGWWKR